MFLEWGWHWDLTGTDLAIYISICSILINVSPGVPLHRFSEYATNKAIQEKEMEFIIAILPLLFYCTYNK